MPCDKPLSAFEIQGRKNANGKAIILFQLPNINTAYKHISLACGRCTGCRLERSRIWAARCMHEASLYENNYFLTLTYEDKNVPLHNSLDGRHLQLFFKRLRKLQNVRHYSCGEYGTLTSRPHYHSIVFGLRLDDLHYYSYNGGNRLYTSALLEKLWKLGNVYVGHVTFESCAYVARYILKKQLGKGALEYYCTYDIHTGELYTWREPEFVRMSRNPGIGADFLNQYHKEMYGPGNDGTITLPGGIKFGTPRYYDNRYEKVDPDLIAKIKEQRRLKAEASQKTHKHRRATVGLRNTRITNLNRKYL